MKQGELQWNTRRVLTTIPEPVATGNGLPASPDSGTRYYSRFSAAAALSARLSGRNVSRASHDRADRCDSAAHTGRRPWLRPWEDSARYFSSTCSAPWS